MRAIVMSGAVALAACAPQGGAGGQDGQSASVRGCQAVATHLWRAPGGAEYAVEALSAGPDCERAVATLVIRDAQGRVLWADARAAEQVMTLAEARDAEAMQAALGGWIDSSSGAMATSAALPEWPPGADAPTSGEFPFYPESYLDRTTYEALRQRDAPLFCYVQGLESMACLSLEQGRFEKVGVQSFPG